MQSAFSNAGGAQTIAALQRERKSKGLLLFPGGPCDRWQPSWAMQSLFKSMAPGLGANFYSFKPENAHPLHLNCMHCRALAAQPYFLDGAHSMAVPPH